MIAEMEQRQEHQHPRFLGGIAACVKYFATRYEEASVEAIVTLLDRPEFSPEAVAAALDELRASGDYDRIVAEAGAKPKPAKAPVNEPRENFR